MSEQIPPPTPTPQPVQPILLGELLSRLLVLNAPVAIPQPTPPQPPTTPIKPVTLSFVGQITNPASKNLRTACCNAVTNGTKEIQILFSSLGGDVSEAFSLHNFLRALPVKLTMHCVGSVDSAAMSVFLAGEQRLCCPDSTFLFHDFTTNFPVPGNITRFQ